MTVRYDDKGKFFTNIVSKDPVPVIVQTLVNRLEGNIYARPDERLLDVMNKEGRFLAMTDVVIKSISGKEMDHTDFLLVNCGQIVWAMERILEDDPPK